MSFGEQVGNATDHLKVALVRDGKVIYDSEKDSKNLPQKFIVPKKPKEFCPDCGQKIQPVIYQCSCCGQRYIQVQEVSSGRVIVFALPPGEDVEKTNPQAVAAAADSNKNLTPST